MQAKDRERALAALGLELQHLGVQKPIRILTPCGGQPSVLLRSNGSVSTMRFLAPPGYTTMPPLCPNPGVTRLLRTFHTRANGYASRHQSHVPDAISFVGIACSPTRTNSLSTPSRLLSPPPPQHLASPTSHVPLLRYRANTSVCKKLVWRATGALKDRHTSRKEASHA
jgi:hypothetical protein